MINTTSLDRTEFESDRWRVRDQHTDKQTSGAKWELVSLEN